MADTRLAFGGLEITYRVYTVSFINDLKSQQVVLCDPFQTQPSPLFFPPLFSFPAVLSCSPASRPPGLPQSHPCSLSFCLSCSCTVCKCAMCFMCKASCAIRSDACTNERYLLGWAGMEGDNRLTASGWEQEFPFPANPSSEIRPSS